MSLARLACLLLCYGMLCYVMLRYVTLRYITLRYVTLCYVMLCYVGKRAFTSIWLGQLFMKGLILNKQILLSASSNSDNEKWGIFPSSLTKDAAHPGGPVNSFTSICDARISQATTLLNFFIPEILFHITRSKSDPFFLDSLISGLL